MHNGSSQGPREDTLPNAVIQKIDVRWTALHEAAATGDDRKLQTILSANADRSSKESKHGNTALHECAWRGYSRCVKVLCTPPSPKKELKDKKLKGVVLETKGALHSALLSIKNDGGFSALHLAAQNGHNQSCREILLAGADPDVQNNHGDTPLHTACRYGHAGATRILLSASCDPNKTNLNGDSPLHIACAMGRRKLTRILLEAGSSRTIKNAQDETPRDITIRKHYGEILDILDNPLNSRSRREKDKNSGSGGGGCVGNKSLNSKRATAGNISDLKGTDQVDLSNMISWSPYGCHYFPDPREFPSPKLETLPKEPLQKGEQYFLDLGGNIRKGPVGVGNTCYCGPFFKHMEQKINRNRKSLRKYVFKATERLDSKVQALALRTDGQIEQLTRSMIADRIRCESRRLHLEHWLKRGEPYRLTTGHYPFKSNKKSKDPNSTLTRSRSLELLDNDIAEPSRLPNSRSFDLLEQAPVTVHRSAEDDEDEVDKAGSSLSIMSMGQASNFDGDRRWDGFETDYHNVSERLEELLAKTNEILEMEKEASKRRKEELLAFTEPVASRRKKERPSFVDLVSPPETTFINDPTIGGEEAPQNVDNNNQPSTSVMEVVAATQNQSQMEMNNETSPVNQPVEADTFKGNLNYSLDNAYVAYFAQMQPGRCRRTQISACSSGASNISQNSATASPAPHPFQHHHHHHQDENHNFQYQNFSQIQNSEHMLQDVITALRKDHQRMHEASETAVALNESENTYEDKLNYKGEQTLLNNVSGLFQNNSLDDFSSSIAPGACESPDHTLKSEKVTMTSVKHISELCEQAVTTENTPLPALENTAYFELAARHESHPNSSLQALNGKNFKRKTPKNSNAQNNNKDYEDLTERVSGTIKKVEIRNSEIKTLKKPSSGGILKRSKVQELVARLQGKLTLATQKVTEAKQKEKSESESSEDEQNEHNETVRGNQLYQHAMKTFEPHTNTLVPLSPVAMYNYSNQARPQFAAPLTNNSNVVSNVPRTAAPSEHFIPTATNATSLETAQGQTCIQVPYHMEGFFPERIIPKDAYFHELPNKNRTSYCQPGRFCSQLKSSTNDDGEQALNMSKKFYHHHNLTPLPHHIQQTALPLERRPISHQNLPSSMIALNSTANPIYNMPPIVIHQPPQPLRTPINKKLLSNRKFTSSSGSPDAAGDTSPDYEITSLKNCNQMRNINLHQHHHHLTADSQVVERDTSNDSGFSTRMYSGGGSHRPSPSLSGQTDYASGGMQSPTMTYTSNPSVILNNGLGTAASDNGGDVGYYVGNVSSLV